MTRRRVAAVVVAALTVLSLASGGPAAVAAHPRTSSPLSVLHTARLSSDEYPTWITVDSVRHLAYVVDGHDGGDDVVLVDTRTGVATTVPLPDGPSAAPIAVDETDGDAYVPVDGLQEISVIRGTTAVGTVQLTSDEGFPQQVIAGAGSTVYVVTDRNVVLIVRGLDIVSELPLDGTPGVGGRAGWAAFDSRSDKLFVPETDRRVLSVVDGVMLKGSLPAGEEPTLAAVDPSTSRVYVVTPTGREDLEDDQGIDIVSEDGARVVTVTTSRYMSSLSVDPRTHVAYAQTSTYPPSTPTYGPTLVIRDDKVVASLDAGFPNQGSRPALPPTPAPSIDVADGIVLLPRDGGVAAVDGERLVESLALPGAADLGYPTAVDPVTGHALVAHGNSITLLQTPRPPTISVRSPRARTYRLGSRLRMRYSCHPGTNNPLISCIGPYPDRHVKVLRRTGRHIYVFTAVSSYGSSVRRTVTIEVRRRRR